MNANEYQALAARTLNEDGRLPNYALGLAGEAGEVAEIVKKHVFHGHEMNLSKLHNELGDVLWYIAALCTATGLDMGDVMEANVAKLRRRYPEGFSSEASIARVDTIIHGSFDRPKVVVENNIHSSYND